MSIKPIELPHWPSGPAIREEQRIADAQRRLDEEAVKPWGSGSPCERPWRPDTGLLQRVPAELYPNWRGPFPIPWERDDRSWPDNDPFLPDLFGRPPSVPTDDPFLPRRLGTCCSQDYSGGYVRGSVATDVFRAFGLPDADPVSGVVDPSWPSTFRVMLAVSSDGLRWQRTNLILADRADVPTMVYDEATGRFWCFFVIFGAHAKHFGAEQEVNDEITEEGRDLHRIVSFKTATGAFQWEAEEGSRLVVDESTGLERGFVKEAAVARAGQSNCYLMAYSTGIPIPSSS